MPPWSTRLLSGSSLHNSSTPRNTPTTSSSNSTDVREEPVPRVTRDYLDAPPTLHPQRNVSSPAGRVPGTRPHTHSRSTSGPLPRIFGRKKSNGNFKLNDSNVQLDEDLVPVADEPQPTTSRVTPGKKSKVEEDSKATRKCMCCDSRVKVPHGLQKFRCLCCLTINDLKPMEEQSETDMERSKPSRSGPPPAHLQSTLRTPLTVQHTSFLITQCVKDYLRSRCVRVEHESLGSGKAPANSDVPNRDIWPGTALKAPDETAAKRLEDSPLAVSPPDTPQEEGFGDSTRGMVREWTEFDQFSGPRADSPPLEPHLLSLARGVTSEPVSRKPAPIPVRPSRQPPAPPIDISNQRPSQRLLLNGSPITNGQNSPRAHPSPRVNAGEYEQRRRYDRIKTIFRPLEDYMIASFGDQQCLNKSFSTVRRAPIGRARSESNIVTPPPEAADQLQPSPVDGLSELDAKTLLLGDIGENGSWWTGKLNRSEKKIKRKNVAEGGVRAVTSKAPSINWTELSHWYDLIHTAGNDWKKRIAHTSDDTFIDTAQDEITGDLHEAKEHAIRTLLKVTENVLKRPSRPIKEPEDLRFLLIILANPSLYPSRRQYHPTAPANPTATRSTPGHSGKMRTTSGPASPKKTQTREGSHHNGLLKRIFGLLANATETCHRYLITWYSRFDEQHFVQTVDLVASFVNYRIARRSGRPRRNSGIDDGGLIPDLSGSAMNTSQQLHSAMGLSGSFKTSAADANGDPDWANDWQIKVAAKFMSLLFAANNVWQGGTRPTDAPRIDTLVAGTTISPQAKAKRSGQLIHTSGFYNTLLDYHDMIADFREWEAKRDKFSFCQYPLFLSMGTKIKILEYDARRQMEIKAREAYFDQVIRQRAIEGNFNLRVRRECMVDDSLRQISAAVGSGQEELKKGLRVHFQGEEGVDAGGPRKEWFLMLVRDIFDPNHGMFVYDEDSQLCYFNANSFETSDQYYLVGALLGLAIYNSTILDVAFPPFAFRKLLAAAPPSIANASNVSSLTGTKGQMTYTLADLAEFRPSLAAGLQGLLDFDGDVQETYCRDFVASIERYGVVVEIPLIPNGEHTPVTNANRHEFVDAYVRYLLDAAVARQFEPFKRGFFTVCAGNALSLFRAEEIELLIRGSDEALDVDSLRAVAVYENWRHFQPPHQAMHNPAESVPVIAWFWELFAEATPEKQRKLLTFITGTDRIPAVGATSLVLRIQAGGDGWGGGGEEERMRFPIARTCFNMLVLWRYDYREQLEEKLWRAVDESEGFGLK